MVGHPSEPIGLHVPEIGELEKKYINECLDSTFVSSVGSFIPKLEERMQEIRVRVTRLPFQTEPSACRLQCFLPASNLATKL